MTKLIWAETPLEETERERWRVKCNYEATDPDIDFKAKIKIGEVHIDGRPISGRENWKRVWKARVQWKVAGWSLDDEKNYGTLAEAKAGVEELRKAVTK